MKVLVVQNNAILNNKTANFNNVEKLLEPYSDKDTDLIVLPEVWAAGWDCSGFEATAEDENGPTVNFLKYIAQKHNALLIGGSYIRRTKDGELKNTSPVISSKGILLAQYDKMHLFSHKGSEEQKYISSGENLLILDTGETRIGLTVCYDIRFPEIFRQYSQKGVEIFISAAAWGRNKLMHWEIMQKARAIENQCYIIAADQTGKIKNNEYNLGHSMVIDCWGDIAGELGEEEGCIYAELDLQKLRELRKNSPLLSDRRNETFKIKEIKLYEETH